MSKLFSLLRATMSGGIQLFNYRGKTERSRRLMPIVLALLIGIMMFFSAMAVTSELKESGGEVAILSIYTIVTAIIIITEGVYKSGDLLFRPRDNDALLAMPIKKSTIVLVRMIKFYVFELIYCLIFLLPSIVAYAVNVEVGALYYFVAITMLLLTPVIPIAVSCVVGLITTGISAKFKYKSFWQVALSFVALLVFVAMVIGLNTTSNFDGQSMMTFNDKVTKFYYPAAAFSELATEFNLGQYLMFVGINLAVTIVTVFLVSKFYFRIITRISMVKRIENTNLNYRFKKHNQTSAMVGKELNKYFNTPVLIMNTALGLVLFLVAVGALCFNFDDIVITLTSSMEDFPITIEEMRSFLPSVTFALVAFASLMTFITTTMISLEGKAFNLLKSMPISGKKVIMTKVLAAMLLIVPVTALGSVVLFARFQFNILEAVLILIGAVAMPLVTELIGILVNLKYARFDAESDAVVVKQSAGVMVATFLGLGMVLLTISLTFAVVFLTGQAAGLAMMDAIYVIVAAFLYFVVAMRGEEKYMKLVA